MRLLSHKAYRMLICESGKWGIGSDNDGQVNGVGRK